jgi:tetratricopeptide (TPR) repeat protein
MRVALAKFEASEGRLETAEGIYREALAGHPDDSRIYNNIATLRHRQGDVDGALTLLARAIELEPTTVNRINYARLLASSGRSSEAIAQLETAVRTAPDAEKRSLAEKELAMTRLWLSRSGELPEIDE